MSDPVWNKLDQHAENIAALRQQMAAAESRMKAMDERIDRNQNAVMETLSRIESKQDITTQWMNESRGGLRFGRWITITGLTIAGIVAGWVKYFKGGG